ncbi:MAG: hypothetical protein CMN31_07345 [Sandaracinus sp.]|nr:hypothetical protein [Myxococcales bacterium]MAT28105.1 hypothetical protein [Sandaracinus sp.]MBJ71142.1 hypothetical protein [Sandaracinus sp.]
MRTVHEALLALEDERFRGPVHVSAPGPFVPLVVLPAFARLADAHPDLVPHLHALDASAAIGALQRGELDVALLEDAPDAPDLAVRALTRLPHAVFAAPAHPLAGDPALPTDAAFVAPPRVRGREVDGYPSHLPRSVRLRVDRMQAAIDAVRTGRYVAYLPTRVGAAHGFVAHPLDAEAATTLHVVHRASLHLPGRTEALVDALFAVEQAARRGDSAAP